MFSAKLYPAVGVVVVASIVAGVLILVSNSAPYSSPEKSIAAFVDAESRADLSGMEKPASAALYRNLIGHFGQTKYREIRNIYQEVYNLADPKWEEYRTRAQAGAEKEHESLAEQINKLGRDAFAALPEDERLKMTEDRPRFEDFVFTEGLKALPSTLRDKIADPQAFRENRDIVEFTNREGFAQLPEEDQQALKSPAALSGDLTPERFAFLESIGIPQLSATQREAIAGIPSSELRDPQEFMFHNGRDPAQDFLKNAALNQNVSTIECKYSAEDDRGSLFKGSNATCTFSIHVRGAEVKSVAEAVKQHGAWKIAVLFPMLTEVPAAYPPRPARREPVEQASAPVQPAVENVPAYVQRPEIPNASWNNATDSTIGAVERDLLFTLLSHASMKLSSRLITALFLLLAIVVFCVIMTINFRRLRQERFLPEWLEGEVQLEEIEVSHWWSRVWLRLTNKRIIQVRLNWLFSRRQVFGVALDDIHSATWRRYINWFLVLLGVLLFGRSNPVALFVFMWGLESRILSIRFNAPLAQMALPRARASITSFSRQQFSELASFYKKAQLHLAQVRTQKQLPVPSNVRFIPEIDKDFAWGRVVWLFVAVWLVVALGQRTLGDHVTLEGFWAALLLGLPVAAASHSLRGGVWSGLLGASAFVAVKLPGSLGLVLLDSGNDGGSPNLWQYLVLVAGAALIGAVAFGLSRVHPMAVFAAPLLWLLPIAVIQPSILGETSTYATLLIAIASSAAFSVVTEAITGRVVPSVSEPEYASV